MLKKRRVYIFGLISLICIIYFFVSRPEAESEDNEAHTALIKRAAKIKAQLDNSEAVINKIKHQIQQLEKGQDLPSDLDNEQGVHVDNHPIVISRRGQASQVSYSLSVISPSDLVCLPADAPRTEQDVQMYDVLNTISFADVDGGVWKQGYDIQYRDSLWSKEKPLKVFVIPHSHNDPGWIKTFDGYYSAQVKKILDNMVVKLGEHEKMKFIYAEISFFSKWWSTATNSQKESVKRHIEDGKLELVTGGWVMPDEASSHYWAMIDQLIEGHAWVKENIGMTGRPLSGWSIDPFGHSSTMAYILKEAGLQNMLIQRVHYSIKKHFAQNKYLEFNWRQIWDGEGDTGILCHMMPFYSYDVPHTCGPDPKICCQFDFQRLPGGKLHCPWKKEPEAITEVNVKEKAFTLLDQYRKKSTLFKSNVVLVPLGDDFRYDSAAEWDKQYTNYQKLFDYMNEADWNVQAQFGTLSDYFNEVRAEMGQPESSEASLDGFPSLSGDFFAYADRIDHYWSGYFTSRPFYKHWDRHLESTLRSAEIIFSLAQAKSLTDGSSSFQASSLYDKLSYARQSLGLFQHHDGITGTAKAAVVVDYGNRMLRGWKSAYEVIRASAQLLVGNVVSAPLEMFDVDWLKDEQDALEIRSVQELKQGEKEKFVIYNSSPHEREELVRVWVSTIPISVYDSESRHVICQISPIFTDHFDDHTSILHNKFKLSFLVKLPPLGMVTYTIEASETQPCTISRVSFYNLGSRSPSDEIFKPEGKKDTEFTIHNDQVEVTMSAASGMMQSVKNKKTGKVNRVEMNFVKYGSSKRSDHSSGAYLFIPSGASQDVASENPLIRVVTGNLFHEVMSFTSLVEHLVRVVNIPGPESLGVEVVNIDSIMKLENTELAMQLSTDIGNDDRIFFSDMNGFTMHKRKYQEKLHLQGNVYPMTSMSYIENSKTRISILAAQSAGVLSPFKGELQVILDRRLSQDDNRGLGEPLKDNKRTESKFFILVEEKTAAGDNRDKTIGYPSMTANILHHHLISPLIALPVKAGEINHPYYEPLSRSWPCELNLINLRSIKDTESGEARTSSLLLVHHQSTDCSLPAKGLSCTSNNGRLDIGDMFRHQSLTSIEKRTITDFESLGDAEHSGKVTVKPMNIMAYKLTVQ
ncbi:alpha-mannosidase 2x-like [Watersipora subatra]|uniref:alpha-mannosidase 2x-like n=1 Tax=Watersipora subatra TaxID=2589382 RepID=UPI00355BC3DA